MPVDDPLDGDVLPIRGTRSGRGSGAPVRFGMGPTELPGGDLVAAGIADLERRVPRRSDANSSLLPGRAVIVMASVRRLMVVVLLAPAAALYAQDPIYDPATLMARAIDHLIKSVDSTAVRMRKMRDQGLPFPIPQHLLEKEKYTFKLSNKIYPVRHPYRRWDWTNGRFKDEVTENPALTSAIATRLGIATTDPLTEQKTCSQKPYPPERGIPGTFRVCVYAHTDRVVGVSLPVVSRDTARVEVIEHLNSFGNYVIVTIFWEVRLVRAGSVWEAVSRRTIATIH
jgi:hypothetical protein